MDVHVIVYRAANQDAVSWVESHLKNLLVRRDAKEMRILLVGTHADMVSGSAPPLGTFANLEEPVSAST